MKQVYLIDKTTRLVLPDTGWGVSVLGSLIAQGKEIEITNEDPEVDLRSPEEKMRAIRILNLAHM